MRWCAVLLGSLCSMASAQTYELKPLAGDTLAWWYNHEGAPPLVRAERVIAALEYAARGWAPCGVRIGYSGDTGAQPGVRDRRNVIGWARLGARPGAGAEDPGGVVRPWTVEGRTVEVDIALDPRTIRTVTELRFVLAHELGHALGLGHAAHPDSIMRTAARYDELDPRPTRLDLRTCEALYR